jgi:hypothetical protein
MLNSQTLDVAIGLSLVFLTLSVIVSAINETLSMIWKTRFTTLQASMDSLLGSKMAQAVINHPAVPAAPSAGGKQPSYIEPSYFTVALLDEVTKAAPAGATNVDAVKAALSNPAALGMADDAAKALISFANHSGGDYGRFVANVSGWFDAYMDRVSGEYKRRAHGVAVIIALVVVVILDVDTVKTFRQLSTQPAYAAALAAKADAVIKQAQVDVGSSNATLGSAVDQINGEIAQIPVPLGWHSDDRAAFKDFRLAWLKILGLLITALAASLGAPFWFDALGKLSNMRSSGTKPDPSAPQPPTSAPPPAPVR